mgnify:CR=1 FL=1
MIDSRISNWRRARRTARRALADRPVRCADSFWRPGNRDLRDKSESPRPGSSSTRLFVSGDPGLRSPPHTGRWRETLERSAIALKLMTYAPSGGIVAAPTAALPEQIGGERNWDYRYTWIRDASFSVYALLGLGFTEEAAALGRWMRDRVHEPVGGAGGPLNIMYRVDGSSDLTEEILPHWEGYRGSSPVRIGNGAADQTAARHLWRGDRQHLLR